MNINLSIFDEFPNLESLSLCHSAGFLSRLISSKIACTKNNMVWWQDDMCQDDRRTGWQDTRMTGCQSDRVPSWQHARMTGWQDDMMPWLPAQSPPWRPSYSSSRAGKRSGVDSKLVVREFVEQNAHWAESLLSREFAEQIWAESSLSSRRERKAKQQLGKVSPLRTSLCVLLTLLNIYRCFFLLLNFF